MDATESHHSDEDTLAPMMAPTQRGNRGANQQQQQQPQSQQNSKQPIGGRRGTLLAAAQSLLPSNHPRKSISLAGNQRGLSLLQMQSRKPERLENTYRLLPKPEERFSRAQVQPLMLEAMEDLLDGVVYDSARAGHLTCDLAQAVRDRVKEAGYHRYKLVVTVCLFQLAGSQKNKSNSQESAPQEAAASSAAAVASRAVWSADCGDCFVECRRSGGGVSAVATLHALYFE